MQRLAWRDAGVRERRLLQRFRCTEEDLQMEVSFVGTTPVHPRMYEWQVQEYIQNLRPPLGKSWLVRVGMDDDQLGAVQVTQEIDAGAHYDLVYGAVALHLQGRDLFIGDEMIEDTTACIASRCVDLGVTEDVHLTTMIHRDNRNSQKMCHRNKFRNQGSYKDDEYDDWERYLHLGSPEEQLRDES